MVERESVRKVQQVAEEQRRRRRRQVRETGRLDAQSEPTREHGKPRPPRPPDPVDPSTVPEPPAPTTENIPTLSMGPGKVDGNNILRYRLPWLIPEELPDPGADYAGVMAWDVTRGRVVVCDGLSWRTIPLSVT